MIEINIRLVRQRPLPLTVFCDNPPVVSEIAQSYLTSASSIGITDWAGCHPAACSHSFRPICRTHAPTKSKNESPRKGRHRASNAASSERLPNPCLTVLALLLVAFLHTWLCPCPCHRPGFCCFRGEMLPGSFGSALAWTLYRPPTDGFCF